MKKRFLFIAMYCVLASIMNAYGQDSVIIIRHGEKPANGDNLDCKGLNRALGLPRSLSSKFSIPLYTYAAAISTGSSTTHARMFELVTPFAVKYNLTVNTKHEEKDVKGAAHAVLGKLGSKRKHGTILMVWEHTNIPPLAAALGIKNAPKWEGDDFDSIWIITKAGKGEATLTIAHEGLNDVSSICP